MTQMRYEEFKDMYDDDTPEAEIKREYKLYSNTYPKKEEL